MKGPIGIFDSGVGGLTVARGIVDQLPQESLIYIGDTANAPYGPKTAERVRACSQAIADDLVARGARMIVIACNTASSVFLDVARERYDVPVIGVIEPAARRAVAASRNGIIGVIGTEGTVASGAYQRAIQRLNPHATVVAAACPQFVPFVERGITTGRQIMGLASAYLEPLQSAGVDTLVLGCTHYPLLTGVIQLVMGDGVTLVSSSEEQAKEVCRIVLTESASGGAGGRGTIAPCGIDAGRGGTSADALLARSRGESSQTDGPARGEGRDQAKDSSALSLPEFDATVINDADYPEPERTFTSTGDPARFARLAKRFLGAEIAARSTVDGDLGL